MYHVFAGDDYYPSGGYLDYDTAFPTQEAAIAYAQGRTKSALTWAHVVYNGKIVWSSSNA